MVGFLSVETAVHCIHICEPSEVFGVDVGQVDLRRYGNVLLELKELTDISSSCI